VSETNSQSRFSKGVIEMTIVKYIFILSYLIIFFVPNILFSKTFKVATGDFHGITKSIKESSDRDTILVAPGTYYGTHNFMGRAIVVKSIEGPESTILDAKRNGSVVTFDHCMQ
jgi:hypothetical protein